MSADRKAATFDAGTAERVLDEYRGTFAEVEQLFRIHVGEETAADVGLDAITTALANLNYRICLVVDRDEGTEYLYAQEGDNGREWYSISEYPHRSVGPLPIYEHNVQDRIDQYPIATEKVALSPFADVKLPEYDLNEDEVTLDV